MPIYEYQCADCGKVIEVLASSMHDDTPPESCACGNRANFTRLYSTFASLVETHTAHRHGTCGSEDRCEGCAMRDTH